VLQANGRSNSADGRDRPHPDGTLIGDLSRTVVDTLASVLPPDAPCAILDVPMISNVGDSAIWLGERRALRALGARITYMSDIGGFAAARLRAHLRRGPILLQGGGTFGDLWPEHQLFREAVIAGFPQHRIIQLPQTINFRNPGNLARARAVLNRHPDLILLLRDRRSLEFARNEFGGATSLLCPDMAFALGPLPRRGPATVDVVALTRADHETCEARPPLWRGIDNGLTLIQDDWAAEPKGPGGVLWKALRRLTRYDRTAGSGRNRLLHPYDALARQRLAYGVGFLSRGRLVITDRLHGHILSLLLGIPHLVLGDRYGKIESVYSTWTHSCVLARWTRADEDPIAIAARRLRNFPLPATAERQH
jgi:exopolysaccharide biosynthesis predicted pyruvyltransferase EpsI